MRRTIALPQSRPPDPPASSTQQHVLRILVLVVMVLLPLFQQLSPFLIIVKNEPFFQVLPSTIPPSQEAKNDKIDSRQHPTSFLEDTATTTTATATAERRRKLPSCQEGNGCVILFIHIPKTGGSTMQATFKSFVSKEKKTHNQEKDFLPYLQYQYSNVGKEPEVKRIQDGLDASTASTSQRPQVHFFEIHGVNNPSFHELVHSGNLAKWRSAATQNNKTFFVFTIVREPLSFALSAYHMICIVQGDCKRPQDDPERRANATSVTDFTHMIQPNPQSGFLMASGIPYHQESERWTHPPTTKEAEDLWEDLQTHTDWIGLTEEYDDTMTVLRAVMGLPNLKLIISNVAKGDRLHRSDLVNMAATDWVKNISHLDEMLYRRVEEHYPIDVWDGL